MATPIVASLNQTSQVPKATPKKSPPIEFTHPLLVAEARAKQAQRLAASTGSVLLGQAPFLGDLHSVPKLPNVWNFSPPPPNMQQIGSVAFQAPDPICSSEHFSLDSRPSKKPRI